ncbi:hypothetical protein SEA_LIBERTYBELL_54 [Streptomyces phage LibertyBell]|nr:hypothetical protein SEA_LIBERTYBELL_54 [Streptomyces phage LibertyBell]
MPRKKVRRSIWGGNKKLRTRHQRLMEKFHNRYWFSTRVAIQNRRGHFELRDREARSRALILALQAKIENEEQ